MTTIYLWLDINLLLLILIGVAFLYRSWVERIDQDRIDAAKRARHYCGSLEE